MVNLDDHLKKSRRRAREREYLTARAKRMLDALLKAEASIPSGGSRINPRIAARERARVKFFSKELDTCRKQLRKLGG